MVRKAGGWDARNWADREEHERERYWKYHGSAAQQLLLLLLCLELQVRAVHVLRQRKGFGVIKLYLFPNLI